MEVTRDRQLAMWRDIIVGWHRAHDAPVMKVSEWPLWENAGISSARARVPVGLFFSSGGCARHALFEQQCVLWLMRRMSLRETPSRERVAC